MPYPSEQVYTLSARSCNVFRALVWGAARGWQCYLWAELSPVSEWVYFLSPITVYAVEVTLVKQRGRVASLVQLFICTGMAVGYFFCYGSLRIQGSLSWRLPFACQTLISSIICGGCFLLPHSPRWLFGKGAWRRTSLGVFMSGFQQLTGVDGLLYYAPVLFTQAGLSSTNASFLASGVSGLVNLVVTIIAQFYTDKWLLYTVIITLGSINTPHY